MKRANLYATTHWDYEWYFTQSESTVQLIYHFDDLLKALEEGAIDYYPFDGQMSIVEEYLNLVPQNQERFAKLVKEGKLALGPWYTQSDTLIIAGESLVRNLYYGMQEAKKWGKPLMIGYLPDSFGMSADLPKILNGIGIKYLLFWRGLDNTVCPSREFYFTSPDGSKVLAYNIQNGYGFGAYMSNPDDVKTFEERILKNTTKNKVLFPMGGDQKAVDFNHKKNLTYFQENSVNGVTYHSQPLEEFYKELEAEGNFNTFSGEMINASFSKIHRSIYSSRYDLKQMNDLAERTLIYQLEPLMVMAERVGIELKPDFLASIWKKLFLCAAHDSACNCNSDSTNDNIRQRLKEVILLASSNCDYLIRKMSESFKTEGKNPLFVYNTLPYTRTVCQTVTLATKQNGFVLKDQKGAEIPYDVVGQEKIYSGSLKRDTSTYDPSLYYYNTTVSVSLTLPPMGMIGLQVVEGSGNRGPGLGSREQGIEDSFYQLSFDKGNITLVDKNTSKRIKNSCYFEEGGDEGDTYDYSPSHQDSIKTFNFEGAEVSVLKGKTFQNLTLKGKLVLPANLQERATGLYSTAMPYCINLNLKNNGLVEAIVEIDNTVCDHRLRLVLNTGLVSKQSLANTAFGFINRDNIDKHLTDWQAIGWREEPTSIYPLLNVVALQQNGQSYAVYCKGIKEYQVIDDTAIALTLFRSVGFLGRPDLLRRPGIASGQEFKYIATPDSQLLKPLTFQFAIGIGKKMGNEELMKTYQEYATPLHYYQKQELNRYTNGLKYFQLNPLPTPLDLLKPLVNADHLEGCYVSAVIPLAEGEFVVRLVNPNLVASKAGSLYIEGLKSYSFATLDYKPLSEVFSANDNIIQLNPLKEGEMVSVLIKI